MNNTANELFPIWYGATDPNPDPNILLLRVDAINKLVKEKKTIFWLDLIRIYLDLQPTDAHTFAKLNEKFFASDDKFPTDNTENLIRCLSSAILCFKLESANTKFSNLVCLATLNVNFLGQYQIYDRIPVLNFASEFYNINAISAREQNNRNYEERLDSLIKSVKASTNPEANTLTSNEIMIMVIEELKKLNQTNKSLAEESNVLWWLFGEHSSTCDRPFKDISIARLTLVAARELSELTTFSYGIDSAKHILNKVLETSHNTGQTTEKISLFDIVNSVNEQVKKDIIGVDDELDEMTPCLLAIKTSLEFKEGEDWRILYKTRCYGGDPNNLYSPIEISIQFYREFLYLKYF